jgi:acetoin utilization deacetylase AcuC-like enzyme
VENLLCTVYNADRPVCYSLLANLPCTLTSFYTITIDSVLMTDEALQYESVYLNEHSVQCAQRAAGGLCALVLAVLQGAVRSGVALIRPPGHHAEQHAAKGKSLI